jgi:multimeric flavodoxin WrbA
MVNVAVPSEIDWEALDASDAIIFGTPTYTG